MLPWKYRCSLTTVCGRALLTARLAGGRVFSKRDAHKSVTAAMIRAGSIRLSDSGIRHGLGLSFGPTLAGFREALNRERVDCVFLISPNYFFIRLFDSHTSICIA